MQKFTLLLFLLYTYSAFATQVILEKTFDANKVQDLVLSNMFGRIEISTHAGNDIVIKARILKGQIPKNVSIEAVSNERIAVCYFETPCNKLRNDFFENTSLEVDNIMEDRNNCNWAAGVQMPNITFEIIMPANQNVDASSIMEGDIVINDIVATVSARNIEGNVALTNVRSVIEASTINGDVDLIYANKPDRDAQFHTINGDINIKTPASVDADVYFKSFNGHFYTDLDPTEIKQHQTVNQKDHGFKYKIERQKRIKFNQGSIALSIETFNGDAYLVSK